MIHRRNRQTHIKNTHILRGETIKLARPDSHLFRYLWDKRLIDHDDYLELERDYCLLQAPSPFAISRLREGRDRDLDIDISQTENAILVGNTGDTTEHGTNIPTDRTDALTGRNRSIRNTTRLVDNPDLSSHMTSEVNVATTNPPMDSGYGSLTNPTINDDEDVVSVRSIITHASRVSLDMTEKGQVTSAFSSDLCQDLDLGQLLADARDRVLTRLPDLLKTFAVRLEQSVNSKAQSDAKEFLRQQRVSVLSPFHSLLY